MAEMQILRERVLSVAEAELEAQGFFGVSMRQVALRAGVHPGTVATLFGNKHNLVKSAEARLRARQAGSGLALVARFRED